MINTRNGAGGRPVFHPSTTEEVEKAWTSLFDTAKSADYMRDMKINAALAELLVLVMSESWHPEDQHSKEEGQRC